MNDHYDEDACPHERCPIRKVKMKNPLCIILQKFKRDQHCPDCVQNTALQFTSCVKLKKLLKLSKISALSFIKCEYSQKSGCED